MEVRRLLGKHQRPEQLARPEGFRSLIEFISVLKTPTSPWLPSEWVQTAIMSWLGEESPDALPSYLFWSTAAAFVVIGALLQRALYAKGYTKAQESGDRWVRQSIFSGVFQKMLKPLGIVKRELIMKEVRLFFRDTTQWSQLILLGVTKKLFVADRLATLVNPVFAAPETYSQFTVISAVVAYSLQIY